MIIKRHAWKKWEVSLKNLKTSAGNRYKLTRKLLNHPISETKIFISKKNAIKQFKKWLK
ncbi:hypothetical protein GF358_04750 [Candidatus Woesearchaeota archaeon]|nr:hypothetical protein [Candidatus Woesearchaeota archaeon]